MFSYKYFTIFATNEKSININWQHSSYINGNSILYPETKTKFAKIAQLEKANEIIRLRRNLFVANPSETRSPLSAGLIANHLLAPSYVSMQTALRHYGLIPEAVYTTQSMTFKAARTYNTPIGSFSFTHISRDAYHIGLTQAREENATYTIATPEKACATLSPICQASTFAIRKKP